MGGSAFSSRPGGLQRRGPSHEIGLAVGDQIGSVRKLTPPSWTSSVAWPIQVAVGTLCRAFSRRKAPSLATRCGAPGRPAIEVRIRRSWKGSVTRGPARWISPARFRKRPLASRGAGPNGAGACAEDAPARASTPAARPAAQPVLRRSGIARA